MNKAAEYNRREFEAGRLTWAHITEAISLAQETLELDADGKAGPLTREALLPSLSPLIVRMINVAAAELGKGETEGNNRGPDVDRYAASCGWGPGSEILWCAAFIYFCYRTACEQLGLERKVMASVGAKRLCQNIIRAGGRKLVKPEIGCIALVRRTGGQHVRLVTGVDGAKYHAIEGNSGPVVKARTYASMDAEFFQWPL